VRGRSSLSTIEKAPQMKWSEFLIKREVDDFIWDKLPDLPPPEQQLFAALRTLCVPPVDTPARVREIRDALERIEAQPSLSSEGRGLIEDLVEELEEIEEDLGYAQSAEGKNNLIFQDYGQALYQTLRNDVRFDDVALLYDLKQEVIAVQGTVGSAAALSLLSDIISANPAPFPVEWKVTVNGEPDA
jgi:hypothetical protein